MYSEAEESTVGAGVRLISIIVAALVFAAGLLAVPVKARASCEAYGCNGEKIIQLYPDTNGDTYLWLDGPTNLVNCTMVSGTYFTVRSSRKNYSSIFSTLLAAKLAERPISVQLIEGTNGCDVGAVILQ